MACLLPGALGHNLIHRICEEVDKPLRVSRLRKNQACICFSMAIKYLGRRSRPCSHCFPQFMCTPGQIKPCLPKNAAEIIYPLDSNTLILINALAHNLFHKICEEPWHRLSTAPAVARVSAAAPGPHQGCDYTSLVRPRPAQILSGPRYSLWIHALGDIPSVLRTLFSTVCVQSLPRLAVIHAA